MVEFLERIPEGTLQNFTFVHHSKSAQRKFVTETWPRVLRMDKHGKMVISFNCNPNSQNYNKVEVIRFDPQDAYLKHSSIDFNKPVKSNRLPSADRGKHFPIHPTYKGHTARLTENLSLIHI